MSSNLPVLSGDEVVMLVINNSDVGFPTSTQTTAKCLGEASRRHRTLPITVKTAQ